MKYFPEKAVVVSAAVADRGAVRSEVFDVLAHGFRVLVGQTLLEAKRGHHEGERQYMF